MVTVPSQEVNFQIFNLILPPQRISLDRLFMQKNTPINLSEESSCISSNSRTLKFQKYSIGLIVIFVWINYFCIEILLTEISRCFFSLHNET